jgi:hypothetical protein
MQRNLFKGLPKRSICECFKNGLWIIYECHKIMLSGTPTEICDFLGLDYNKWLYGFENKIEIFEWIIKCKYFNQSYFIQENYNNHKLKHRFETRPFVKEFINYLDTLPGGAERHQSGELLDYIEKFNKQNVKQKIDDKMTISKLYQDKFSGRVFLQYTDAKNINRYKDEFKNFILGEEQDFENYLRTNDLEKINNDIKEFIFNKTEKS